MQEVFDRRSDLELQPGYHSLRQRRAGGHRLALIAGIFGCGLLSAGLVWEYADHRTRTVPVIEADSRPLRIKPENPGGMQIAGAGESILSGPEQTPQSLAPPPELPDPGGLHLQEQSTHARENAALAPPGPAAGTLDQNLSAAGHAESPPPPSAAFQPLMAPVPPAIVAPHPPPLAAAPPVGVSGRQVQFAAVGSEAAANAEWARLAHLMPDLLGHRRPEISHVERDGHVYWRLRTGGFADASAVSNFCNQVHAKGVACTSAGF